MPDLLGSAAGITTFYGAYAAIAVATIWALKDQHPKWSIPMGSVFIVGALTVELFRHSPGSASATIIAPASNEEPASRNAGSAALPGNHVQPPKGPSLNPPHVTRPPPLKPSRQIIHADTSQAQAIQTDDGELPFAVKYYPLGMSGAGDSEMLVDVRPNSEGTFMLSGQRSHKVTLGVHTYTLQLVGEPADRTEWTLTRNR